MNVSNVSEAHACAATVCEFDSVTKEEAAETEGFGGDTKALVPSLEDCEDVVIWSRYLDRISEGRDLLNHVVCTLAELDAVERRYAAGLRSCAEKLRVPASVSGTSSAEAVGAFRRSLQKRAHHCEELAVALRSELNDRDMKRTVFTHYKTLEKMKIDISLVRKTVADAQIAYEKSMATSVRCEKAAINEALANQRNYSRFANYSSRYSVQSLRTSNAAVKAEEAFKAATKRYQLARENWLRQKSNFVKNLADMDEKRIACMKNGLMAMQVYRASQHRNFEYDSQQFTKDVERINAEQELKVLASTFPLLKKEMRRDSASIECIPDPPPAQPLLRQRENEVRVLARRRSSTSSEAMGTVASEPVPAASMRSLLRTGRLDAVVKRAQASITEIASQLSGDGNIDVEQPTHIASEAISGSSLGDCWDMVQEEFLADNSTSTPLPPEEEKSRQLFAKVLDEIFEGRIDELWESCGGNGQIKQLTDDFHHAYSRKTFCLALQERVQTKRCWIRNRTGFYILCGICESLLDQTDFYQDWVSGRSVMLMSPKIFVVDTWEKDPETQIRVWQYPKTREDAQNITVTETKPEADKHEILNYRDGTAAKLNAKSDELVIWRLSRGIYSHPFWNKISFWTEALTMTVSEDLQRKTLLDFCENMEKMDQRETLLQAFDARNPFCDCVTTFGYCMVLFGVKTDKVKEMVVSVSKRFDLGPDYETKLVESIAKKNLVAPM